MKVLNLFSISLLLFSLLSCKKDNPVIYEMPLNDLKALADSLNKPFCIILTDGGCVPCKNFINRLEAGEFKELRKKGLFNVVNTTVPGNEWYRHWICNASSPVSCIFNSKGEMMAAVNGSTPKCLNCIEMSMDGNSACAEYIFSTPFSRQSNRLAFDVFNKSLNIKQKIERGEDAEIAIERLLQNMPYPYLYYLQCTNFRNQGEEEAARESAEEFLKFTDSHYLYLYGNLIPEMKKVLNPAYDPELEGYLEMAPKEMKIEKCKVETPFDFEVTVKNTGKSPVKIHDVLLSCTCMEALGDKQERLAPGESDTMKFRFIPDKAGEYSRNITFTNDGKEPVVVFTLEATAK